MTSKTKFLTFWPDLVGPCKQKSGLVSDHHSADRAKILQQSASC